MTRALVALIGLAAAPLAAQQDSLLREAVRLATEGQADTAQAIVRNQLRAIPANDQRFPEVLFTAGVVATDTDSARSYFRRISLEYSNSSWADQALLRIAQISYATGDLDGAVRAAERVLIDYPFSEVRAGAAFLLARTHLDRRNNAEGCRYLEQARQEAGDDVELSNRAAFYLQRCADAGAAAGAEPEAPAAGGRFFSVQVAAVSSAAAADAIMQGLRVEGYSPEVVREGGLFKVRVGRFRQRAAAEELAREVRRRIGGEAFVVERS